jgi:hypothetical protein
VGAVSDIHDLIREAMGAYGHSKRLDTILNACPDMECSECATIVCPHADEMHFHHDGCPSCACDDEGEDMSTAEQTAREAVAQFEFEPMPPDDPEDI